MIAIVDYGLGNLSSVKYALDRIGVESQLTADPQQILAAKAVILPGVGALGKAMERMRTLNLIDATIAVAGSGKYLLGICLGHQLLFASSEEHGIHKGLNILPGKSVRFAKDLTVPHMGWNQVTQVRQCPLFEGIKDASYFYFAHSYYVLPDNPALTVGQTEYGVNFTSVVQREAVFGIQFHPEKSGRAGEQMLANFCRLAGLK